MLAFIADFKRWNAAAHERSERAGKSDALQLESMEVAKQEYAELLARYCQPGFVGEPISFGTPPMHDPDCEFVVTTAFSGDSCLVQTRMISEVTGVEMVDEFKYSLLCNNGYWYVDSVKCMIDGVDYESL